MFELDPVLIIAVLSACALGGLLKGATGAGAPVIGVPVIAALFDVQFAVAVFVVPNLLTNLSQGWRYRRELLPWHFIVLFAGGGGLGAVLGTYLLAGLPSDTLSIAMAFAVLVYVGFRIVKSDWTLGYATAVGFAGPIGFLGGLLQGATGISAPASLTFLNAMQLSRGAFIATISVFFTMMSITQFERMIALGLLDQQKFFVGLGATITILVVMPAGAYLARRISRAGFDRAILGLLVVIALKVLIEKSIA